MPGFNKKTKVGRLHSKMGKPVSKRCTYCGHPMYHSREHSLWYQDAAVTIDHGIPKSRGGTDDRANLIYCCYGCNQAKRDLTVQEFMSLRGSWTERGLSPEANQQAKDAAALRSHYKQKEILRRGQELSSFEGSDVHGDDGIV